MFWIQNAFMFILGATVSLIGPLFIGAFVRAMAFKWDVSIPLSGLTLFLLISLVFLPLIYWWEWRTQGMHLEHAIAENRDWFQGSASSYGEWEARKRVAGIMLGTEFILWAPRQVLQSIHRFRIRNRLKHISQHRAAELLADLQRYDGGILIKQLSRADETRDQLYDVLGYLSLFDWIGISKDGHRVWMLSQARKRFA